METDGGEDGVETAQMSAPGSKESCQDRTSTWENWLRNVKMCVFNAPDDAQDTK